jgi:hypothetical protein
MHDDTDLKKHFDEAHEQWKYQATKIQPCTSRKEKELVNAIEDARERKERKPELGIFD